MGKSVAGRTAKHRNSYHNAQRLSNAVYDNTNGGTNVLRCTMCTNKRINGRRLHCDRKHVFIAETTTSLKVVDKNKFKFNFGKLFLQVDIITGTK